MKKIDLNLKSDSFLLWEKEYKYKYKDEDRVYYLNKIKSLDHKKDNTSILIEVFTDILKKQNPDIEIIQEDVIWLFHYFNSVFL